jgi:alpha-L-fucosidase
MPEPSVKKPARRSPASPSGAAREEKMRWWTEARLGLFIHWGLYALPARHEWVASRERLADEAYRRYFDHFDPDLYDPAAWARAAKNAGMKYVVVTAKHHEGFCLWDSAFTDYKATRTPAGKDLLRPLAEAVRAEGLRFGIYYSLLDWHHPDYTVDIFHPRRDDPEFVKKAKRPDFSKYVDYLFNQVRELLTGYGPIDILFLDYSFPGPGGKGRTEWRSEKLLRVIRSLQPGIIVNDRLDLLDVPGGWDYRTPEQFVPEEGISSGGRPVPWETCQTFSGSWGYHRDESTWKSVRQLVVILAETVGKGGNLLLNVGPTARGTFDGRALERLEGIGEWMRTNGRSVYGCTRAPRSFAKPRNCLLTYHPDAGRIYVHVLEWPPGFLRLEGFAGRASYAQLLHDGSECPFVKQETEIGFFSGPRPPAAADDLTLRIPVSEPGIALPTIEIFLK